jgi:hypothetical protein
MFNSHRSGKGMYTYSKVSPSKDLTLLHSVLIARKTFLSLSFQTRWFTTATSYICIILPLWSVLPQKNYQLVVSTGITGRRMNL